MSGLEAAVRELLERSRSVVLADPISITLGVAGTRIRLMSAGPAMLDFVRPAFAHLPILDEETAADLTVWLWDTESTGEKPLELPLPPIEDEAVGVVNAEDILLSYRRVEKSMSFLQRSTNEAFFIAEAAGSIPEWARPQPLRHLLSWWFCDRGLLLAHSAAVSTPDGAALLVGPSGSGKSSTALACLSAGMGYLGDDYVIVDPAKREVWSLYSSARLVAEHHDRYPHLMTSDSTTSGEPGVIKRIGWPGVEFADRVSLWAQARAFVLPTVTRGPECRLLPSTAARALLALAPTTLFQAVALKKKVFELSSAAVRPFLPIRLELGHGVESVPAQLSELIASGAGLR